MLFAALQIRYVRQHCEYFVEFWSFGGILGGGCIVLPGVTIGEGCSVGSMSLIAKYLEPWAVYAGAPSRKIKDRKKDIILACDKALKNNKMRRKKYT